MNQQRLSRKLSKTVSANFQKRSQYPVRLRRGCLLKHCESDELIIRIQRSLEQKKNQNEINGSFEIQVTRK